MKRNIFAVAAAAVLGMAMTVGCTARDRYTNNVNELPDAARTVLTTHFANLKVAQIKIDNDEYDVQFTNGTKLEFNKKGELKEVDPVLGDTVPSSLVPSAIKNYVTTNYPGQKIIKYESDRRDQEVKISSGIELKFDKQGKFLYID